MIDKGLIIDYLLYTTVCVQSIKAPPHPQNVLYITVLNRFCYILAGKFTLPTFSYNEPLYDIVYHIILLLTRLCMVSCSTCGLRLPKCDISIGMKWNISPVEQFVMFLINHLCFIDNVSPGYTS